MATSRPQLFLELLTEDITRVPNANEGHAAAALALACTAKNPQRHRLSAWGWRGMHAAEQERARALRTDIQYRDDWLERAATLIRSNTDVMGGSLMVRLRNVVSGWAVFHSVLHNLSARQPNLLPMIQEEQRRAEFWFGPRNMAQDVTQPAVDNEMVFSDGIYESSSDADDMSDEA